MRDHCGLDIITRMILDHIRGGQSCLPGCFGILLSFIDQNIQKYAQFDHDDPNHTIFINMHTVHGMKYYSYCTVFNNLSYLVYTV